MAPKEENSSKVDLVTRKRILDGAAQLFFRFGIKSITMDEIARQLAISKKTIYHYFKNKDEIVYSAADAQFCREAEIMDVLLNKCESALEELMLISQATKRIYTVMNPSILFDIQRYHPKTWELFETHKEHHMRMSITRNLNRGMAEGYYRSDLDVELLAMMRTDVEETVMLKYIHSRRDPYQIEWQLLDHFVRGVINATGLAKWEVLIADVASGKINFDTEPIVAVWTGIINKIQATTTEGQGLH